MLFRSNGIPSQPGQALVLGEPYLNLWPQVKSKGKESKGIVFISTDDWTSGKDVSSIIGKVPHNIAQVNNNSYFKKLKGLFTKESFTQVNEYPSKFPFKKL